MAALLTGGRRSPGPWLLAGAAAREHGCAVNQTTPVPGEQMLRVGDRQVGVAMLRAQEQVGVQRVAPTRASGVWLDLQQDGQLRARVGSGPGRQDTLCSPGYVSEAGSERSRVSRRERSQKGPYYRRHSNSGGGDRHQPQPKI